MKSKRMIAIMILFLFVFSTILPATGSVILAFEGAGTEASPYLIRTTEDLLAIPDYSTDYYKLANDIDFENSTIDVIGAFCGTLDGSGYSIKNFNIFKSTSESTGLFSDLIGANIMNLNFENSKVYITDQTRIQYGGLLAGTATDSEISSVQMKDFRVEGYNMWVIGGIVGLAENTIISNCLGENPNIWGYSSTGMICGDLVNSQIRNTHSVGGKGTSNFGSIGGLVGDAKDSSIYRCSSTTNTSAYARFGCDAGGLVGSTYENVSISECYTKNSTGTVSSSGGIVGTVRGDNLVIDNSYASSTFWNEAGGLVGGMTYGNVFDVTITNCYTKLNGSIDYAFSPKESVMNISNSYYDNDIIELSNPLACGRTTAEMCQQSNYVGWDFDNIWSIDEGNDFPKLQFQN